MVTLLSNGCDVLVASYLNIGATCIGVTCKSHIKLATPMSIRSRARASVLVCRESFD